MQKHRINGKIGTIILVLVIFFTPEASWASLQNEMQGLFNTMTNVTNGNYYEGMGRGAVMGPSVVMRNKRVRTDLFNFVPPSIDAGCGGIDMFLGSFSFINKDQFINLMQSIASNAAGYAFKLALSTMCPTCDSAITALQRAMQKLNAMAGNSCRVAQAGVDYLADKLDATGLAKKMEGGPLATLATQVGDKADAFSSFLDKINTGSNTKSLSEGDVLAVLGNAAWKVLHKNGYIGSAFVSGDNDLAEALMSVTGTVVGDKGPGDVPIIHDYPPTLTVKQLLEGTNPATGVKPTKYHCVDTDNCVNITTVDYDFQGLENMVETVLLGSDGNAGPDSFIFKLATNTGTLTDQEKELIRVAPYHMTRLRNMAICAGAGNLGSMPVYAKKASRLIALEVLENYLRDAMASIMQISQGMGVDVNGVNVAVALAPKYRANMQKVQKELRAEEASLGNNLTTDLEGIYQSATKDCNLKAVNLINPIPGK